MVGAKSCIYFVITLSVSALLSHQASIPDGEQAKTDVGLYKADQDDVNILTLTNFMQDVSEQKYAWFIEFYAHWCGGCQRFAPIWKALATDVLPWRNLLRIGVIDCANEKHTELCRNFEIMGYPTVRYFHEDYRIVADSTSSMKAIGSDVSRGFDLISMRDNLILKIILEQAAGRGAMYPDLRPYIDETPASLFELARQVAKHVLLIVEESGPYLGAALVLDFNQVSDKIIVKYSISNNTALLKSLNISIEHNLPFVFVVGYDNKSEIVFARSSDKNELKSQIVEYLATKNITIDNTTVGIISSTTIAPPTTNSPITNHQNETHDLVFQVDLELALRYSLKREVLRNRFLTGEKLDAFIAYINLLANYFPFGRKGKQFLKSINDTINNATKTIGESATIDRSALLELFKKTESNNSGVFSVGPHAEWLGCSGSVPSLRGYPCGVWKLFHYLTVNADNADNPREVLDAMLGYIKNFFGCAECSQHFQEMAAKQGFKNVSSLDEAVIWLWSAHNQVNQRLAGDQSEDPAHPKRQFPVAEHCPVCRQGNGEWNMVEVLKYLRRVYDKNNVRLLNTVMFVDDEGASNSDVLFNFNRIYLLLSVIFFYLF